MFERGAVDDVPDAVSRRDAVIAKAETARDAGDWPTALGLLRDNMAVLLGDRPRWMGAMLAAAPDDCLVDPTLRLTRDFILGIPGGDLPRGAADEGSPESRATAAVIQVMSLRLLGRLDEAEQVASAAGPAVRAAEASGSDDRAALTRLQFGILRLLRGDLAAALEDFQLANLMAQQARSHFVIRNSAGNLALIHALRGNLTAAERWLTMFDGAEVDPDGELERTVRVGGTAARALVAVGRLRVDEAEAVVEQLRDVHPAEELWVFVAMARAFVAYLRGDAMEGLAVLDEAEASHRATTAEVGIARRILSSARVEMLLAVGQAGRACALLEANDDPVRKVVHRQAVVALVTGDLVEAMPLADAMAWSPTASLRTRASGFVVGAVARWRYDAAGARNVDARAEAHQLLARAVELCEPEGLIEAFALVPREELSEIAASGPFAARIERLLATPELAAIGPLLPAHLPVVELSDRELAVLAELATTRSFDVVAKRLFVSTNTVKTQVRQLHRKLGVHSREEALSVAYREGLLVHRAQVDAPDPSGRSLLA